MRVAELFSYRRFRLVEQPLAEPGPGEVQVRIEAVGICGSDLHHFSDGQIGASPTTYPIVMGHEPAGRVVKTGPGVTGWGLGDVAALEPSQFCYHCEFCRQARFNLCSNLVFLSATPYPGFFREAVNLPAHNLLPLPPGLSLEEATLFEPMAIVLHSLKQAAPQIGETAAVFGAGPIGLLTVFVLKLTGAARVWSVEPLAHRREMARAMGADVVLDPAAADPVEEIRSDTGGRGVDLALDCASKGDSMNQSIGAVRRGGRFVLTGIPTGAYHSLDIETLRLRELAFFNVRRSNDDSRTALELIGQHRVRLAPLLTHRFPLEDIQRAFETLHRYEDGVGKVLLKP
jgi:L-iditol 2-dehydrogenase